MAKPKIKFNIKELLLTKGEKIVLAAAGLGLALLLLWGATTWAGAASPADESKKLVGPAGQIYAAIGRDEKAPPLPDWASPDKKTDYPKVPVKEFLTSGLKFDPIAKPDTKRENPRVEGIEEYQVDLVRAPMKAYDIDDSTDNPRIAVQVKKAAGELNQTKFDAIKQGIKRQVGTGKKAAKAPPKAPPAGMNNPMAGAVVPPPGLGFDNGGKFRASEQRDDRTVKYVALEDLDKEMAAGSTPAMTVVPLRMVVVNATFPWKKQLEEVRRAMRFQTAAEVAPYVHFDGFEVKRKVSRTLPSGEVVVVQDWAEYEYDDKYIELIGSRKLSDYFEGSDKKNEQGAYMPYFYRYEDGLVMPLPDLVPELGSYPRITLPSITATIEKMRADQTEEVTPSKLLERLKGKDGGGKSWLIPQGAGPAADIFGKQNFTAPYMEAGKPAAPAGKGAVAAAKGTEVDHQLLRFVDCDVRPGFTYEYQIRVRMLNPNYGQEKYVANPAWAGEQYRVLLGPWVQLREALTVPAEAHLYAYDPEAYRKEVKETYKDQPSLLKRFQLPTETAKANSQTVVQAAAWLEQVRTDVGGKREPVGAWVVAEMPVGRAEFIGRKTYVKLPLWSSGTNQYVLREVPAAALPKKDKDQPKGWLVNFSSPSILVDFDGGKIATKANGKSFDEDVTTEVLIVRPDGTLQVRNSDTDMADPTRAKVSDEWTKWVTEVDKRPAAGDGPKNDFNRPGTGAQP